MARIVIFIGRTYRSHPNGLRKSAKEILEHEDDLRKKAKNADELDEIEKVVEELKRVVGEQGTGGDITKSFFQNAKIALKEEDFHKDDLISSIGTNIVTLQEVKDWEWYSSKLTKNGFEVYMKGMFRGIFLPMIHQQGIPHTSLFIEREKVKSIQHGHLPMYLLIENGILTH